MNKLVTQASISQTSRAGFHELEKLVQKKLWHFSELWRAFLRLIGELIGAEAGVVAAPTSTSNRFHPQTIRV